MRGFGVVSVAYKGISIACKRNTLTLGLKEKNHCSSQLDACHHVSDDCHHEEDELDEAAEGYHFHPVSGRLVHFHCARRTVDLVVAELAHWDASSRWFIGPFGPELLSTSTQAFSRLKRSDAVAMQE